MLLSRRYTLLYDCTVPHHFDIEIKLSQRMEVAAFVQDANLFVITEGEAARVVNFHSGKV